MHEGDWESILIGLDANNRPDTVVLSQHDSAASCAANELEENDEGGPIAYVGLASHANYPRQGRYAAPSISESDYADGGFAAVRPGLVVLEGSLPAWTAWSGHWGNSSAESEAESTSPQGPNFHDAAGAPEDWAASAGECERGFESEEAARSSSRGATAPVVKEVEFDEGSPQVSYRVPGADGKGYWPRLRLTVDELGDGHVAPRSITFSGVKSQGSRVMPYLVPPGTEAQIRGSLVYANGRRLHLAPRTVRAPAGQ